jgi:hypothetical protein
MYEGKIIRFIAGQKEFDGLIAVFDENVGVTIVNANDKEVYLYCLKLPGSPKFIEGPHELERAKKRLAYTIKAIEQGVFNVEEYFKETDQFCLIQEPTAASCAFS